MIAIHYFASIREALGCDTEKITLPEGVTTVGGLLDCLVSNRDTVWAETLGEGTVMIAVNQEMADKSTAIGDGDEVAFFPPVTGG